jgi:hypothetical protein
MNTWLAPLQGQPGWKVKQAQAYNVSRTSSGCPSTHNGLKVYSIEISDMQGANNQMPGFVMHMGGWGVAYPAVLHEMGHGIGLGDGYVYANGVHTPIGQPTSIMKDAWSHNGVLQEDDINGIRFLWARIRGDANTCPPGYIPGACTGSMCNAAFYCVKGSGPTTTTGTCSQANEGSAVSLSCPSGQVIGSINLASYGTPNGSCPNVSMGSCHASTSKSKVEAACLNKQSCSVSANNGVFGDPCGGTVKRLAVTYSCRAVSSGTCGQAKEGSSLSLSCPSGKVIGSISFASYGTPNGSCPSFSTSSCHASSSKSRVESSCLNKQSCSVSANNAVFGDPCGGTVKKLAVTYSCR